MDIHVAARGYLGVHEAQRLQAMIVLSPPCPSLKGVYEYFRCIESVKQANLRY